MKKLLFTRTNENQHWVGDGFPVRSIFSYNDIAKEISPFLLMDYAAPVEFKPSKQIRGVGEHPHRGFETVTIVYSGEVEHRDSAGGGGQIGPGDVQWMTAASGLVHEEKHGAEFSKKGGTFEMVQLWINLPAKDKMSKPRYQGITNKSIAKIDLPNDAGRVRVIAGQFGDARGPAKTYSPINLWDIRLSPGAPVEFSVPADQTAVVFVLSGAVKLNDGKTLSEAELGVLERVGTTFTLEATEPSKLLFLGGEPLNEPIVGYGPFVMNTMQEIQQAFVDFQSGRMGQIGKIEGSR